MNELSSVDANICDLMVFFCMNIFQNELKIFIFLPIYKWSIHVFYFLKSNFQTYKLMGHYCREKVIQFNTDIKLKLHLQQKYQKISKN